MSYEKNPYNKIMSIKCQDFTGELFSICLNILTYIIYVACPCKLEHNIGLLLEFIGHH